MTRADIDTAPFVAWAVANAPAIAREALGVACAEQSVTEALLSTVRERSDLGWADGYRRACPVAGLPAGAYRLREVSLRCGARVLAGIHFYAGDTTRPFVGVLAQTRELTPTERTDATRALCAEFAAFAPAAAWWWVAGEEATRGSDPGVVDDQRLLVGIVSELVRGDAEPHGLAFGFRRDDTGASFDAYVALFDAFLAAHPCWRGGALQRSERDDYMRCASAGGLFVAEHEGRVAGVFAARPGEVRGIPGWLVEEMLLGDALRGRGLATRLQRAALAELDTSHAPLILGTINARNEPSLRTARRVGRRDVGGWVFVRSAPGGAGWPS